MAPISRAELRAHPKGALLLDTGFTFDALFSRWQRRFQAGTERSLANQHSINTLRQLTLIGFAAPGMSFEDEIRAAAQNAEEAVNEVMADYSAGQVTDEDDITGLLLGNLRNSFNGIVGGLQWKASILRHRAGVAAEEKKIGADMLIHVSMNTPSQTYSKGGLVQAKRLQPKRLMSKEDHTDLLDQCRRMLSYSPASFGFDYAKGAMRCGSASKVEGAESRELYKVCDWRSYRFFLELFRY